MDPARTPLDGNSPSVWSPLHLKSLAAGPSCEAPPINDSDVVPLDASLGIWDSWPVQDPDGSPAPLIGGGALWMALGSPRFADPFERHNHARIHLFLHKAGRWQHLGPAMPEGFSPGSREWSGSAVLDRGRMLVTLYFTAAGRRGEAAPTFEQRLFSAEATLVDRSPVPALSNWRNLREIAPLDSRWYMGTKASTAESGAIKAYRDPAYFLDPEPGREYIFFAASLAQSQSEFNGAVGAAVRHAGGAREWQLLPPIVSADGLNNELERPHVIRHEGRYYLFWSTQQHVFNPAGPVGPTGLYGMVSDHLAGDWYPLNETGLVFANPRSAPSQAYAWQVLPDLSVIGFVDQWRVAAPKPKGARFGGTLAPVLQLRLDFDRARLV